MPKENPIWQCAGAEDHLIELWNSARPEYTGPEIAARLSNKYGYEVSSSEISVRIARLRAKGVRLNHRQSSKVASVTLPKIGK